METEAERAVRTSAAKAMGDLATSGDAPFGGEVALNSQVGGWVVLSGSGGWVGVAAPAVAPALALACCPCALLPLHTACAPLYCPVPRASWL